MSGKLHWGILGTGNIARQFAQGVQDSELGQLAAVASRSLRQARDFAARYRIPAAHGSYAALLADTTVQAVYVSLPNHLHHSWTIQALRAGKHVLCEKPLAMTCAQAQEMFEIAQRQERILIEAFMYLCHPLTGAWLAKIREGAIGRVQLVRAGFCYCARKEEGNVRFDLALGGGALMDVGCYCISLARLLGEGEPVYQEATARFHPGGVDVLTAGTLLFDNGLVASFHCGMKTHADNTLMIGGDRGCLLIPIPWKPPVPQATFTLIHSIPPRMDTPPPPALPPTPQVFQVAAHQSLYGLEADAFVRCVRGEAPPFVSREQSLGHMRTLDALREKIGLHWQADPTRR